MGHQNLEWVFQGSFYLILRTEIKTHTHIDKLQENSFQKRSHDSGQKTLSKVTMNSL